MPTRIVKSSLFNVNSKWCVAGSNRLDAFYCNPFLLNGLGDSELTNFKRYEIIANRLSHDERGDILTFLNGYTLECRGNKVSMPIPDITQSDNDLLKVFLNSFYFHIEWHEDSFYNQAHLYFSDSDCQPFIDIDYPNNNAEHLDVDIQVDENSVHLISRSTSEAVFGFTTFIECKTIIPTLSFKEITKGFIFRKGSFWDEPFDYSFWTAFKAMLKYRDKVSIYYDKEFRSYKDSFNGFIIFKPTDDRSKKQLLLHLLKEAVMSSGHSNLLNCDGTFYSINEHCSHCLLPHDALLQCITNKSLLRRLINKSTHNKWKNFEPQMDFKDGSSVSFFFRPLFYYVQRNDIFQGLDPDETCQENLDRFFSKALWFVIQYIFDLQTVMSECESYIDDYSIHGGLPPFSYGNKECGFTIAPKSCYYKQDILQYLETVLNYFTDVASTLEELCFMASNPEMISDLYQAYRQETDTLFVHKLFRKIQEDPIYFAGECDTKMYRIEPDDSMVRTVVNYFITGELQ